MKKIFTLKETKIYVKELEKKLDSLERSHSYRIGNAIIDFYKIPVYKQIFHIKNLFNNLRAAFKKKRYSQNIHCDIRVYLDDNNVPKKNKHKSIHATDNMNFMLPTIKYQDVVLSFHPWSSEDKSLLNISLTPNNFTQLLLCGNADRILLDTDHIIHNKLWDGFGTYDEIILTMSFLKYLEENKAIEKILIHNEDIAMFPLLLKHINLFNEVRIHKNIQNNLNGSEA